MTWSCCTDRRIGTAGLGGSCTGGGPPPQTGESAIHRDDQSDHLVGTDLVMLNIVADDARDLIEIAPRATFFKSRPN
jgi:hypothetical protein